MAGYIGGKVAISSPQQIETKHTITATASQTSIPNIGYTVGAVHVYQNGVRLVDGTDYTATNGSTVTLETGATEGDQIVVVSHGSFETGDVVSKASGGTFSGNVTMAGNLGVVGDIDVDGTTNLDVVDIDGAVNIATTALVTGVLTTTAATVFNGGFAANAASTITTADNLSGLIVASTDADANAGPTIQLKRDSSSPADNDLAGNIIFVAENDASEATVYANIGAHLQDVTNGTEDGKFFINTMIAGAEKSRIFMTATETAFNEESADIDFRIESDSNTHALFLEASSGNIFIATAAEPSASQTGVRISGTNGQNFWKSSNSGTSGYDQFAFFNGNGLVGTITTSGSATAYSTSSDYRLKTDAQPMTGASDRLLKLKPVNFKWIADGTRVDGFLAHEVQAVVPESVTGTKDEVDDNGDAVMQGIDQSKIVPLLVSSLQEALARITALENA